MNFFFFFWAHDFRVAIHSLRYVGLRACHEFEIVSFHHSALNRTPGNSRYLSSISQLWPRYSPLFKPQVSKISIIRSTVSLNSLRGRPRVSKKWEFCKRLLVSVPLSPSYPEKVETILFGTPISSYLIVSNGPLHLGLGRSSMRFFPVVSWLQIGLHEKKICWCGCKCEVLKFWCSAIFVIRVP